ncbi:MAG: PEGA domain-containing protein [Nannocystaceae bacterium]
MQRERRAPSPASARSGQWRFVLIGLGWLLPFAEIHGAASSPELEASLAPAILEVRADHGARVDIDGATYGQAPVEVRVPAGEHRIEVFAAGYHPWRATVQLGAQSRVTMITDLLAEESPADDRSGRVSKGAPGRAGVFLPTPRRRVFMAQMKAADASALLASAPKGTGSSALLPSRPAPQPEQSVFLPTAAPRTFLPRTRPSRPADELMHEPAEPVPTR